MTRILVLEDDDRSRESLCRMLEKISDQITVDCVLQSNTEGRLSLSERRTVECTVSEYKAAFGTASEGAVFSVPSDVCGQSRCGYVL